MPSWLVPVGQTSDFKLKDYLAPDLHMIALSSVVKNILNVNIQLDI